MKRLLLLALVVLWSIPQWAASAVLTTNGSSCPGTTNTTAIVVNLPEDKGGATLTVAGTWTGTISFYGTGSGGINGGGIWTALSVLPIGSSTAVTSTTANGTWQVNVAGFTGVCMLSSASMTGSATVTITPSAASARSNGGSSSGSGNANYTGTQNVLAKGSGTAHTLIDSSITDNGTTIAATESISTTGGVTTGVGGTTAGFYDFGQGTAHAPTANSVSFWAPTSVATAYGHAFAGAAYTSFPWWTSVANVMTETAGTAANIISLWASGSCSGYLKSDGTCSTPSSSVAWDAITNPAGNMALSMGTNTSIFSGTAATSQFFAWKNTTAAVVGTSQGSPILSDCGQAWVTGAVTGEDCMNFSELPGNGLNAAITFTLGHTGASTGQRALLSFTPGLCTTA